ncbi:UNVERIFIED_CONTAM: hypothetical protein PYX00_001130 [Menopon gallinae]|uniref:Uncharacterized protein n=1 Tax=Menopon gallinae TaxID=328185 RepID=A0AAW2ICT6_9NEOP
MCPRKKFYFGMEENNNDIQIVNNYGSTNNVDKTNAEHRITSVEKSKNLMNSYKTDSGREWEESLEKFAATYHKTPVTFPNGNTTSCSSSFVSDPDEDVDGGIALQLRPTLPKKQLEIPRFSPTAAWRLLSSIETYHPTAASPSCSDDGPVLLEERINGPLSQQALQHSHDKSGDSGISGDASPGGCHESFSELAMTSGKNSKNLLMAWTPQQDLEEESSSDDLESPLSSSKNATSNIPGAKFSPRGQLFSAREQTFSLSLPRDDSLGHYIETEESKGRNGLDHTSKFNSLKKLKAALATSKRNGILDETGLNQDGNWVLSRSVPSSLNNSGHATAIRSISNPSSPDQDDEQFQQGLSLKYPSYSYLANGGRMMYLPEYQSRLSPDIAKKSHNMKSSAALSKSCENISSEMRQIGRTPSPVVSQNTEERYQPENSGNGQRKKKFTFQSTVRLIENKRLAERLSREAELKECQRLSELEAMKKVEEEFQKKRAREKANIRHQLRLFSLEEKNYSSLPPIDWSGARVEPDGAPSSLPTASSARVQSQSSRKMSAGRKVEGNNKYAPSTQVLSEYREPMRDYRDYRIMRYHDVQEQSAEPNRRSIVEHPRVVYDIPKNTAVYVSAHSAQNQCYEGEVRGMATPRSSSSDNYRKDFAHGALAVGGRSLAGSDSELSQSHTRPTSRQGLAQQKLSAVHRSRF